MVESDQTAARSSTSAGSVALATKPFDATGKDLIEADPAGWLAFLGVVRPPDRVAVIDADLATLSAAADKVIRVADDPPWLAHVELQAGRDGGLPDRILMYNAILHARHGLPVRSSVVLLRPAAGPGVTGTVAFAPPGGPAWEFRYEVVKLWEVPPAVLLTGPLGTLPLAPISDVPRAETPGVVQRVYDRANREAAPSLAGKLRAATHILLGLRFEEAEIEEIMFRIHGIEESSTYRTVMNAMAEGEARGRAEGRAEEARRLLLDLGRAKLGPPPRRVKTATTKLTDLDRIEGLIRGIFTADSWNDLFPPAK